MLTGKGLAVHSGIAIGKIRIYQKGTLLLPKFSGDIQQEQNAFDMACQAAKNQLYQLYESQKETLGEEQASILEMQALMLEDLDFQEYAAQLIANHHSAAEAAAESGKFFGESFAAMEDEYMRARSADVQDAAQRVVRILCGDIEKEKISEPCIVLAEDLSPSETVEFPREHILSFVTRQGTFQSHTAILSRTMNIPSLVQANIPLISSLNGKLMIVDGISGQYYIEPDEGTLLTMQKKQLDFLETQKKLEAYRGKRTITKHGRNIQLYANIGQADDIKAALAADAEGIGLMRSEFLYLGRTSLPTEEELYHAYRKTVTGMQGRPVIIRTLDIGADKKADYFQLSHEENPALGYRGIRICLDRKDLFRQQLRAIYRAAALGEISIMFPMITSLWEVQNIKAFCREIQQELLQEGVDFGSARLGIMVETPAAAIISDSLAKEVDFFSIGTNDLTQYTLAIDRQNAKLHSFYDAHHPALLKLLKWIINSAHQAGIPVGICGELAADPTMTDSLIQLGVDELSVSPAHILTLRKAICESEANYPPVC